MRLRKKLVIGVISAFSVVAMFSTSAFAKNLVYDTLADSLSVRTGPGTSYAIVATIYTGTDVVSGGSPGGNGDGFRYSYVYYPKSSVGKYSSAAMGYVAYQTYDYSELYLYPTKYAYGTSDPSKLYLNDSLTNADKSYPKGTQFKYNVRDSELNAEDSNPNAWRVSRSDTGNVLYYLDGWRANAQVNP